MIRGLPPMPLPQVGDGRQRPQGRADFASLLASPKSESSTAEAPSPIAQGNCALLTSTLVEELASAADPLVAIPSLVLQAPPEATSEEAVANGGASQSPMPARTPAPAMVQSPIPQSLLGLLEPAGQLPALPAPAQTPTPPSTVLELPNSAIPVQAHTSPSTTTAPILEIRLEAGVGRESPVEAALSATAIASEPTMPLPEVLLDATGEEPFHLRPIVTDPDLPVVPENQPCAPPMAGFVSPNVDAAIPLPPAHTPPVAVEFPLTAPDRPQWPIVDVGRENAMAPIAPLAPTVVTNSVVPPEPTLPSASPVPTRPETLPWRHELSEAGPTPQRSFGAAPVDRWLLDELQLGPIASTAATPLTPPRTASEPGLVPALPSAPSTPPTRIAEAEVTLVVADLSLPASRAAEPSAIDRPPTLTRSVPSAPAHTSLAPAEPDARVVDLLVAVFPPPIATPARTGSTSPSTVEVADVQIPSLPLAPLEAPEVLDANRDAGAVTVTIDASEGVVELVTPWRLVATGSLAQSAGRGRLEPADQASRSTTPTVPESRRPLSMSRPSGPPPVVPTGVTRSRGSIFVPGDELRRPPEPMSTAEGIAPRSSSLGGTVSWPMRLLRWFEDGEQGSTVWLRDFTATPAAANALVDEIRRFAQAEGLPLKRVVLNGRTLWSGTPSNDDKT